MATTKMKKVGAGWKKETQKSGKPYLSIVINGGLGPDIHLTIWPNGYKEKDEQPDYIVYLSEPAAKSEGKQEFPGQASTPDFPETDGSAPAGDDIPF